MWRSRRTLSWGLRGPFLGPFNLPESASLYNLPSARIQSLTRWIRPSPRDIPFQDFALGDGGGRRLTKGTQRRRMFDDYTSNDGKFVG
jgi:hypothetical protein